jgi:cytochrome b subunit of formate dehydrogenase
MEKTPAIKVKNGIRYFFRFTVNQRVQHFILAWSVVTLVLTGMPLKFPDASWAPYLYSLFGGIHAAPVIHKVFGAILLALFVYHVVYLVYVIYKFQVLPMKKKDGLSIFKVLKLLANQPLVPNLKDAKDIGQLMKYLLYLSTTRPDGAKYTWKEKFDYWAPFWGMIIIGFSGLVMWNKELATVLFPGQLINFSLIAHSDEALLAALFLFIWHWYNAHFSQAVFPMGTAFITGYLPEELMVEEHYEEYVEIMTKEGLEDEILPPHGTQAEASGEGGHA